MLTERKTPDLPEWLHELYPFCTRTGMVGNFRMSFVDEGPEDSDPILMLHGNSTWSFLFRHLIRQVRSTRRVIAPDHVGFGLSEKPRDPGYHTLERHITNLESLVEELGLRNITLVAHGWGGPISLGYAVRHPRNVARVVLCNTWVLPVANAEQIRLPLRMRIASSGRIGRFLDSVLNLALVASISSRAASRLSDWTIEGYKHPFPTMGSRAALSQFSRMFLRPSEADRATMLKIYGSLKDILAPTDILVGEKDPLMTRLPAFLLRDAIPNAREPMFIANASHLLPEDAPDSLAEIVLRTGPPPANDNAPESLFKILR